MQQLNARVSFNSCGCRGSGAGAGRAGHSSGPDKNAHRRDFENRKKSLIICRNTRNYTVNPVIMQHYRNVSVNNILRVTSTSLS